MYRLWTGKIPHPFRERDLPDHSALRDLLCDCVAENPEERPESTYLIKSLMAIADEQVVAELPAPQPTSPPIKPAKSVPSQPVKAAKSVPFQAEKKSDEQAWQKACKKNTVEAYQAYLDGNTLKQYKREASNKKEEKEQEFLTGCLGGIFVVLSVVSFGWLLWYVITQRILSPDIIPLFIFLSFLILKGIYKVIVNSVDNSEK
jgi:hypothetical protein